MEMDKLFADQSTIKITVVKIDGKRMTKSIFNQIIYKHPFDEIYNLEEGVKFLGYINDELLSIIYTKNEKLYTFSFAHHLRFINIDLDKDSITELHTYYPSDEVKRLFGHINDLGFYEYRDYGISQVFSKAGQYEVLDKQEYLKRLRSEIMKRQIFL